MTKSQERTRLWRGAEIWHIGRSWNGHPLEDECPCPQEPCGLVAQDKVDPSCEQHKLNQTIRQSHSVSACPGRV